MNLQDTFYVMGIIYMAIMFIAMIIGLVAVLVIKAKINAIQRSIEEKLHTVATLAHVGEALVGKVTHRK